MTLNIRLPTPEVLDEAETGVAGNGQRLVEIERSLWIKDG